LLLALEEAVLGVGEAPEVVDWDVAAEDEDEGSEP
jgi:hypothetical protein